MKFITVVAAAALTATPCSAAAAVAAQSTAVAADQVKQADALGECFAAKATSQDRLELMRWTVTNLASVPKLALVTNIPPAEKIAIDKRVAAIMTRLFTKDCRTIARSVLRASNPIAFRVAGRALGKVALQEILTDAKALESATSYAKYVDTAAIAAIAE